jgi:hypothetical protein
MSDTTTSENDEPKRVSVSVSRNLLAPGAPLSVSIDRDLLDWLAPEHPRVVNEMGGCVFCVGADPEDMDPGPNFFRHRDDCQWVAARKIICATAEHTVDANGLVTVAEARNMLRHWGFNLVSKYSRSNGTDDLYGYLADEAADENDAVDNRRGLTQYFFCEDKDDMKIQLSFVKNWIQARLKGEANPAKMQRAR